MNGTGKHAAICAETVPTFDVTKLSDEQLRFNVEAKKNLAKSERKPDQRAEQLRGAAVYQAEIDRRAAMRSEK